MSAKHVVIGVCGSIAAYKAADLIRRFQDQGCEVSAVMTKEAQEFITPLTLSTLCGREVYTQMFDKGNWRMGHIELARADALVIAPATANVIAKLAHGLADDFLTTLALTTKARIFIAPAMNDDMFANSIVQGNCALLKKHGMTFIEPVKGKLACGVIGVGHLADIDEIVRTVLKKK